MRLTSREIILPLDGNALVLAIGLATALALAGQLALGASPWLVLEVAVMVAMGLACFVLAGTYNVGGWLALLYLLGSVIIALWAKTIFGQTLGSYLYSPFSSFSLMLLGVVALSAALLVVKGIPLGRPLFRPLTSPRRLSRLAWISFGLGVLFWYADHYEQSTHGSGFGGFAALRDLMLMGIIARTAMLLERSGDTRTVDGVLLAMIGLAVLTGLMSDSKGRAAYPVLTYFITVMFYKRGFPLRHFVVMLIGAVMFIYVVTPYVNAWRNLGAQGMPLGQRMSLIVHSVERGVLGGDFHRYVDRARRTIGWGYYNYFDDPYRSRMLLGRFATVQQVDPVVPRVDEAGTMGMKAVTPALLCLLPRIVYPDKPPCLTPYHILVHYGVIIPPAGNEPMLPLVGQAYAAFGAWGVVIIAFFVFLGVFLVYKKLGWSLYRNIYAIFFFVDFAPAHAAAGDVMQYVGVTVRYFPMYAVIFALIAMAERGRGRDAESDAYANPKSQQYRP